MTDTDSSTTPSSTDTKRPSRRSILDAVSRDGVEAAPHPGGRTDSGASRRSVLSAIGALGTTALAGCTGLLPGNAAAFEAKPALLPRHSSGDHHDGDAWMNLASVDHVTVTHTVERIGLSKDVEVGMWGATYIPTVARGGDAEPFPWLPRSSNGDAQAGEVVLLSTPRVEIGGRELNPAAELQPETLLGTLRVADGADGDDADGVNADEEPITTHRIDGLDDVGRHLRRAYGGRLRAVSDVRVTDAGARSLDAERPVVMTAEARLADGQETPILGRVERYDRGDTYLFKASWIAVEDRESAVGVVMDGPAQTRSTIRELERSDIGSADIIQIPNCDVGEFVQDCMDGCSGHDCEVRCLVKFAYMTVEEAERWLRWCPIIMFPHELHHDAVELAIRETDAGTVEHVDDPAADEFHG